MSNRHIDSWQARMNVTWHGQNGDLYEAVPYDATDAELIGMAAEAIRGGSIQGIRRDRGVNLRHFVVDRFPANRDTPYNRIFVRPKTPFGSDR